MYFLDKALGGFRRGGLLAWAEWEVRRAAAMVACGAQRLFVQPAEHSAGRQCTPGANLPALYCTVLWRLILNLALVSSIRLDSTRLQRKAWKTVRVFVSSTFKDFFSERDWLVKHVFPEFRYDTVAWQHSFSRVCLTHKSVVAIQSYCAESADLIVVCWIDALARSLSNSLYKYHTYILVHKYHTCSLFTRLRK